MREMTVKKILICDDEKNMRWVLARELGNLGYQVVLAANGREALELLRDGEEKTVDLVLMDLRMPEFDGMAALVEIKRHWHELPVIMMTAYGTVDTAVQTMKQGAADYLLKPFDIEEVAITIERALGIKALERQVAALTEQLDAKNTLCRLQGKSEAMQQVFSLIGQVAETSATVLLTGESGTGKELAASAIHRLSLRNGGPFVQVNCAAIPTNLLESELFGYKKGAFTGAIKDKPGKFTLAHQGTIFLDEIGDMDLELQAKLLRVLQERKVEPVGSTQSEEIDVRIIAATNQNVEHLISRQKFRADLFYRLNVFPIHLPPLRQRAGDVPLLSKHFLTKYDWKKKVNGFSPGAMRWLLEYHWPGNVRELENVIERAVILVKQGEISLKHLSVEQRELPEAMMVVEQAVDLVNTGFLGEFPETGIDLDEVEREIIQKALVKAKGNQTKAAALLNISRHTLIYRMKKHDLE